MPALIEQLPNDSSSNDNDSTDLGPYSFPCLNQNVPINNIYINNPVNLNNQDAVLRGTSFHQDLTGLSLFSDTEFGMNPIGYNLNEPS